MRVLVAEDDLTSRRLLEGVLKGWGYSVTLTSDGDQAWDVLQGEDCPPIAILDWLMPGLTGPELCQRLANREEGSFVYTVLLTSKTERADKIEGLDSGAHSYVRKPLDPLELRSCLRVGERVVRYEETLREKNTQLAEYATEMEQLAEERAQQLAHADRMATLGLLVAGIAHEINNPATFISGNAQTLQNAWGTIREKLQNGEVADSPESKRLALILEEVPKMLSGIRDGVKRITVITNGLKAYARRDKPKREAFDIHEAIERALVLCRNSLKYHVEIKKDFCENLPMLMGDTQQIEQVLVNLFVNAGHAMKSQEKGILSISTSSLESIVEVAVEDTGYGIPVESIDKLFDPFFTTKKAGEGTGLGLSISHDIARDHGGTLSAENLAGGGAKFILRLPKGTSETGRIIQQREKIA